MLIVAAIGLFDVAELLRIWKIDRWEFAVSIITTLGVVGLDILNDILMAVLISRGCLRLRRICRNIGSGSRPVVGNPTRVNSSSRNLSHPAPPFGAAALVGEAQPYCENSFLLDEFVRFDTELVTGEQRDSTLEIR